MNLILCIHHKIGCQVLQHVLDHEEVWDLAVFTHDSWEHEGNVYNLAKAHDVWVTRESINKTELPFAPDIIASVYYRGIIQPHVIEACEGRIFNAHPSLLPKHRGCSAVPWAIIEGDKLTGITYHYIDAGIDTGNILLQRAVQIEPDETQATLYEKCMAEGAHFWPAALELVKAGFGGAPQTGSDYSYHKRGCPHDGEIGEDWPLGYVERFIRAMLYPPLPAARFRGQEVRSLEDYRRVLATAAAPTSASGSKRSAVALRR